MTHRTSLADRLTAWSQQTRIGQAATTGDQWIAERITTPARRLLTPLRRTPPVPASHTAVRDQNIYWV